MNHSSNNIFLSDGQDAATSGKLTHGSLFSGIGGFDLAAEWMEWENVFHCEWNEFGQKVLKYYWPNAESFNDITKTNFKKYAGKIDILTGGFPCQPYSSAGKRKGKEDERHLWPEMLRAIREIRPRWVVGENVLGLTNWNGGLVFEEVQADLEAEGYEVQPFILPAASVGAPHKRDRVWFVAYATNNGLEYREKSGGLSESQGKTRISARRFIKAKSEIPNTTGPSSFRGNKNNGQGESRFFDQESKGNDWQNFPTQSPIRMRDDGLPTELDGITFPKWRNESIKAYGNAIVPQVVYQIFKAIEEYERNH